MSLFIDVISNRTATQINLNQKLDVIKRENNPQITSKLTPIINDLLAINDSIKNIQARVNTCQDRILKKQLTDQLCNEYVKYYERSIDQAKIIDACPQALLSRMGFGANGVFLLEKIIQAIKIDQSINALQLKADNLDNAGHSVAAEKTRTLANKIETILSEELIVQRVLLKIKLKECQDAFADARPELEKHRDSNYIIANVMMAILTAGVGYLLAALANKAITGNFLFFSKTNTAAQADQLEKQINEVAHPSARGG